MKHPTSGDRLDGTHADPLPLLNHVMRKLKSAIRQPIRYAGNQRRGKMLFSYAKGKVYLPGQILTNLVLTGVGSRTRCSSSGHYSVTATSGTSYRGVQLITNTGCHPRLRHFDEPARRYYTGPRDMEPRTERFYSENADALADDYGRADPTYLAQVRTLAGDDARIVDVECGTARDVARLREAGLNAIGVNQSAQMLAAGKRRCNLPDPALAVDSLPELSSLGDRRFEVVFCAAM